VGQLPRVFDRRLPIVKVDSGTAAFEHVKSGFAEVRDEDLSEIALQQGLYCWDFKITF
jgi:hypothetical protein